MYPSPCLQIPCFDKDAEFGAQYLERVRVKGKVILTKDLGGHFSGWTTAWAADGRKILSKQDPSQVEAPTEDGLQSAVF